MAQGWVSPQQPRCYMLTSTWASLPTESPLVQCVCVTKTQDNQLDLWVQFAAIEHSDPTDGDQTDVLDLPGVILNQTSYLVTNREKKVL